MVMKLKMWNELNWRRSSRRILINYKKPLIHILFITFFITIYLSTFSLASRDQLGKRGNRRRCGTEYSCVRFECDGRYWENVTRKSSADNWGKRDIYQEALHIVAIRGKDHRQKFKNIQTQQCSTTTK